MAKGNEISNGIIFLFPHMTNGRWIVHGTKNKTFKRKRNNNATNIVGRNGNWFKINKSIINDIN